MSTATERALNVEGGVWLSMNEATGSTLWPRCIYPAADDALAAYEEHLGPFYTCGDERVRLTWAVGEPGDYGWWYWCDEFRESWESVECWLVTP